MAEIGRLKYLYWAYLSHPAADRQVYRVVRKRPIRSILEVGMGAAQRTQRMLQLALGHKLAEPLAYTGVDLFEDRPAGEPRIALKDAFTLLRRMNVRAKLIPGDPFSALGRLGNAPSPADLIVVGADVDQAALSRAWCFVPRLMHDATLVFAQSSPTGPFRQLDRHAVETLAGGTTMRLRRAA